MWMRKTKWDKDKDEKGITQDELKGKDKEKDGEKDAEE